MIARRWAAVCTLAFALIAGCATTHKEEPVAAAPTAPEKTAALKARYAALPGSAVGEVADANDSYAVVEGIDGKVIAKGDVLHFIDVETNTSIAQGELDEVRPSGRITVAYDKSGTRAPRPGDLCVKVK